MEIENEILRDLGPIEIQKYQQNRYPCFFVDMIEEAIPGKSAKGHKCFTYNEWFFPAHFEDEPNVPGFVQIETMAQVFLMTFLTLPGNKGLKAAAVSSKAKFKMKIIPGKRLDLHAELNSYTRGLASGKVKGYIEGELACELEIIASIPEIMIKYRPNT